MYGFDYELEPANEGVGSFFTMVLNKIKAAGEKIKDWIDRVALKLRRMTGTTNADQVKDDSSDALKKIDEIGNGIADILKSCSKQINILYSAFEKVGRGEETKYVTTQMDQGQELYSAVRHGKDVSKPKTKTDWNTRATTRDGKNYDLTKSYKAKGGMDLIDKNAAKDEKAMAEWDNAKKEVALALADQKGKAEKISDDLKSLASYGPLGVTATKTGYSKLRDIFNANGTFGAGWKKVKIAAEWSTGVIKEALNKVVSMYDVGIRATDAFGGRLARGYVRDDEGEKMSKSDLKALKSTSAFTNKVYKGDASSRDISVDRDSSGFMDYTRRKSARESANDVLGRIYQMAYEDAIEDIQMTQEALDVYDSVPGAYEFVEESYDPEFEMDYDPMYDLV